MQAIKYATRVLLLVTLTYPLLGVNGCDPATMLVVRGAAGAAAAGEMAAGGLVLFAIWPIITYEPETEEWLVEKFSVIATMEQFDSGGERYYNCRQNISGTPDILYRKQGESGCNYVVSCLHWTKGNTDYRGCPRIPLERYRALIQYGNTILDSLTLRARERALRRLMRENAQVVDAGDRLAQQQSVEITERAGQQEGDNAPALQETEDAPRNEGKQRPTMADTLRQARRAARKDREWIEREEKQSHTRTGTLREALRDAREVRERLEYTAPGGRRLPAICYDDPILPACQEP